MTNRAKKISELTENVSPSSDDLLVLVDSPSSNAITKKVTVGNLLGNTSANVTVSNSATLSVKNIVVRNKQTPVNSTATAPAGTIYFDDNYIYIVTATGVTKRAALTAF